MYCPNCSAKLEAGARFCPKCAAPLTGSAPPPGQPAPPPRPPAPSLPPGFSPPPGGQPASWQDAHRDPMPPPAPAEYGAAPAISAFGKRYAGFWMRFLAVLIDFFTIGLVSWLLFLPLLFGAALVQERDPSAGFAANFAVQMLSALTGWLVCSLFDSSKFQGTPGKIALGIVITDLNGGRISFGRATGRYFAKILSAMTLMVGYFIQPFTERRQALHDILASTLVVHKT